MDNSDDFVGYVNSVIALDNLEKLSEDLDRDIQDSKKLIDQIQGVFDTLPKRSRSSTDSGLRHEDVSKFLEADVPNLLLPDMCDSVLEIDLDDVLVTMKAYAEDLKTSCAVLEPKTDFTKEDVHNLELDQYAFSLDQLGKRLANIKLTKREEVNNRNPELEGKLTELCQDVNNFTQLVQAKTKLTECNKSWPETQQDSTSLQYNDIITKLLSGVNEVIYLLQQSNK